MELVHSVNETGKYFKMRIIKSRVELPQTIACIVFELTCFSEMSGSTTQQTFNSSSTERRPCSPPHEKQV